MQRQTCPICSGLFSTKASLRVHLKNLHSPADDKDKVFKCKKCDQILPDKYSLILHRKDHGPEVKILRSRSKPEVKILSCELCKFTTKNEQTLENHMLERHKKPNPNMFYCDFKGCEQVLHYEK